MPNLLVNDICQAIRASGALRIYVCNVATQPGETDGYDVGDHVQAIENHTVPEIVDYVIANNDLSHPLPVEGQSQLVKPTFDSRYDHRVVFGDLVSQENPWRHDPEKLARCIMQIYEGQGS